MAKHIHKLLTTYLTDAHAIEEQQILAQERAAAEKIHGTFGKVVETTLREQAA